MQLRLISYLLIASFTVLFTPRSWWHDCHAEHSGGIEKNETVIKKDDCFACDYHIPFASQALSPFKIREYAFSKNTTFVAVCNQTLDSEFAYLLRGPPVCV
jgi:hypothetical protein